MDTNAFSQSNPFSKLIEHIFPGENMPGLTKIKNDDYSAVYVSEARSMLKKERHYVFAIGGSNMISVGSHVRLSDIHELKCLQFRTFEEPVEQHVLTSYIEFNPQCQQIFIKRYTISEDANKKKISEYMFEYDHQFYNVHLFHSTESDFEFMPDGNLLSALLTWDTLIIPSVDIVKGEQSLHTPPPMTPPATPPPRRTKSSLHRTTNHWLRNPQ